MKLLSDMRGIERVEVTAGRHSPPGHEESSHASELAARRLAIVTDSPVAYGMARMYQMLAENTGGAIQVFRQIEEATAWAPVRGGGGSRRRSGRHARPLTALP